MPPRDPLNCWPVKKHVTAAAFHRDTLPRDAVLAGKPARHRDGYARWVAKYDARDRGIEETYFDPAGKPTWHSQGYVRWTAKFDERGNKVEVIFEDNQAKPDQSILSFNKLVDLQMRVEHLEQGPGPAPGGGFGIAGRLAADTPISVAF